MVDIASTHESDAHMWRSAAIGAAIGFVVVTAGITAGGTVGGMGSVNAFGLGAFAGTWSGAGFGFMLGASSSLARQHRADHA